MNHGMKGFYLYILVPVHNVSAVPDGTLCNHRRPIIRETSGNPGRRLIRVFKVPVKRSVKENSSLIQLIYLIKLYFTCKRFVRVWR